MTDVKNENNIRYEKKDVNLVSVFGLSAIFIIVLVVILVFLIDYFVKSKEEIVYETQLKPESIELKDLFAAEKEKLSGYKILDQDKGIYQIPIDQAMELLAREASDNN